MTLKEQLRTRMRQKRAIFAPRWMARAGAKAQRFVLGTEEFRNARTVSCYMAMPREVKTDMIIEACSVKASASVCRSTAGRGPLRPGVADPDRPHRSGSARIREPARPRMVRVPDDRPGHSARTRVRRRR